MMSGPVNEQVQWTLTRHNGTQSTTMCTDQDAGLHRAPYPVTVTWCVSRDSRVSRGCYEARHVTRVPCSSVCIYNPCWSAAFPRPLNIALEPFYKYTWLKLFYKDNSPVVFTSVYLLNVSNNRAYGWCWVMVSSFRFIIKGHVTK